MSGENTFFMHEAEYILQFFCLFFSGKTFFKDFLFYFILITKCKLFFGGFRKEKKNIFENEWIKKSE